VRAWRSNGRSLGLGHFLYRWRASATWGSLFPHVLCSQRQLAGPAWTPVVSGTRDRVAGPGPGSVTESRRPFSLGIDRGMYGFVCTVRACRMVMVVAVVRD
jgi:hypothetical protein